MNVLDTDTGEMVRTLVLPTGTYDPARREDLPDMFSQCHDASKSHRSIYHRNTTFVDVRCDWGRIAHMQVKLVE